MQWLKLVAEERKKIDEATETMYDAAEKLGQCFDASIYEKYSKAQLYIMIHTSPQECKKIIRKSADILAKSAETGLRLTSKPSSSS